MSFPQGQSEAFGVDERFRYVQSGMKRLRRGYTTGTCAALAAQAAARALLLGGEPSEASLTTPAGIVVRVPAEALSLEDGAATCGVRKNGGDDEDATDGLLICARVGYRKADGVAVEGGRGVGIVTKPGLDQPVGAAAINSVPRAMIVEQVRKVAHEAQCEKGLIVTVSVPEGERVGAKTFNPHLGIEGGISILGTSGIVEPRSLDALRASIEVEVRQAAIIGNGRLVVVPGNYGDGFTDTVAALKGVPRAQCANFIGDALQFAARAGARQLLLVGHIGKMVKVAAGDEHPFPRRRLPSRNAVRARGDRGRRSGMRPRIDGRRDDRRLPGDSGTSRAQRSRHGIVVAGDPASPRSPCARRA